MMYIQLSEWQQKDLVNAISSATFGPVYDGFIALTRYEPNVVAITVHRLEIDFYLTTRDNNHSFQLRIDYYDEKPKINPETIALISLADDSSYRFLPLSRLGYVIDKLREYGIW